MSNLMHGKTIATTSYYEGEVKSIKNEIEQSLFTTRENLLKDIIDALVVIHKQETHKLNIEVCIDSKGRYRLIKKWVV